MQTARGGGRAGGARRTLLGLLPALAAAGGRPRRGPARAQEPSGGGTPPHSAGEGAMTPDGVPGPGVALGLYQVAFPDDLSAVGECEAATGQRLGVVHWYAL